MKRVVLALTFTFAASLSFASGEYLDEFLKHYKIAEGSPFAEKSCGICHVSDSDFSFDAYGKDLKKAMTDKGVTTVDAVLLASLETLDSDGDGKSNGDEIKALTFPGDPASGGAPGVAAASSTPAPKKKSSFPPKNAFHPAIVHFPIALFIGGLVLDLLGMLRKDKTMLQAGWYCIVLGAITTIGGILSGVVAMMLMKLPYRGLIFQHMVFAVGSSVIMGILVFMRIHRHEKMNLPLRSVYYILATACFLGISWAGHLGGVFVYGE